MVNIQNKQKATQQGRKYIRIGKILGFLALIMIPASPLYAPLFCNKLPESNTCDLSNFGLLEAIIVIAIILAIIAIALWVKGGQMNKANNN